MKLSQNSIKWIKVMIILILLLVSIIRSPAMLVFSQATNDIYIGVCGESVVNFGNSEWVTNTVPIRYDDKLAIMSFCRTGAVKLLYPCNKSVFVKIQMRDLAGKEVAKTVEGKSWGSDVGRFPSKPSLNVHDKMASWGAAGSHTNGFSDYSTGPWLPPCKDLFEMKDSEIYELTLEVHLMKQHMLGTTNTLRTPNWTWDHIVIPPVTVKVEKPPSKH